MTTVREAAAFIDGTLQNEGAWYRADDVEGRLGGSLASYGASVGAVRGTVRDALRKFRDLDHDGVVFLASALWGIPKPGSRPVFERRLAAVVLLQARVGLLRHTDLTRLEGFLRSAHTAELTEPLIGDVLVPLLGGLGESDRRKAVAVLERWQTDTDRQLRAAARIGGTMNDPYGLERFVAAQDSGGTYPQALAELQVGQKRSHWIWFVFPQIAGLGQSPTAQRYAIGSLDEARAYLAHPVLGPRLLECAQALTDHGGRSAEDILGGIDARKLHSSMTLFLRATPGETVFKTVLSKFFGGEPDAATDELLAAPAGSAGK